MAGPRATLQKPKKGRPSSQGEHGFDRTDPIIPETLLQALESLPLQKHTNLSTTATEAGSDYGPDLDSDDEQLLMTILSQIEQDIPRSQLLVKPSPPEPGSQPDSQVVHSFTESYSGSFISGSEEAAILPHVNVPDRLDDGAVASPVRVHGLCTTQSGIKLNLEADQAGSSQVGAKFPLHHLGQTAQGDMIDRHALPCVNPPKEAEHGDTVAQQLDKSGAAGPSPLERYRRSRPLSVSDLVSPTWCELQYSLSLSKYGQVKRTVQMKRGNQVHRDLELQVHEFVPVEVKTREDGWGLRLWNVILGLRALRLTGITRELDVWGILNGQVISGVIDEVTCACPDREFELGLHASKEDSQPCSQPPGGELTIDRFFAKRKAKQDNIIQREKQVYILDTKTRVFPNMPSEKNFRATRLQLMLYRHLLAQLCTDKVPGQAVFSCYKLDSEAVFSPVFMNSIAGLDCSVADQKFPDLTSSTSTRPAADINQHANLASLWKLMTSEFAQTLSSATLSPILTAVFRAQASGSVIGSKSALYDDAELDKHINHQLEWWRGTREAQGVDIEDTYKCKTCDFVDDCDWRKAREVDLVEAALQRPKRRGRPRKKSS